MNKRTLLNLALVFIIFLLISNLFSSKNKTEPSLEKGDFVIQTTQGEFKQGKAVAIKLKNNTDKEITLKSECPGEPFDVYFLDGQEEQKREVSVEIDCKTLIEGSTQNIILTPKNTDGDTATVDYTYWSNKLFDKTGRYRIQTEVQTGDIKRIFKSNEFTINERGAFGNFWRTGIYQPIYNTLILSIKYAPGKNLAFAIILLTIIIRLILLIPSQRAIVSQRKLQEVQPKLEEIRKKYAGNQEKIAEETMHIWKEHKVNPFGSCLPLLIQFPILIALFYVIQSGLNPDNSVLLYGFLKDFTFGDIDKYFLTMDLTQINKFVLPIIVGGLQFAQMKLAEIKKEKKEEPKKEEKKKFGDEMQIATKMMTYVMPIMIAIFTASMPSGVGLYWGTSTLFGIGQQLVANYKFDHKK